MASVETADAATMAMIEALRAIADGQRQMAKGLEGIQAETKEQGKMLLDVRERVVRIESNRLDAEVADMKQTCSGLDKRIDALEADKDRRDGALGLGQWLFRNWPAVIGYVGLLFAILRATGKI